MNTSTCLISTVKNVSGSELVCAAWPPHGRTFEADEEASVFGDIIAAITRGNRPQRLIQSFIDMLTDGTLELIKTPAPILFDATADRTAMLFLDNNALAAKDPCWADTEFSSPL